MNRFSTYRCNSKVIGRLERMAGPNLRIFAFVVCGILFSATYTGGQGLREQSSQTATPSADLSRIQGEAIIWLQDLIRINTINPPGNEIVAAKYIADILKREGIPSEIFEITPGRGFLVARLSDTAVPDPLRALLLLGCLDVVGMDKSKWSVDPFAA